MKGQLNTKILFQNKAFQTQKVVNKFQAIKTKYQISINTH